MGRRPSPTTPSRARHPTRHPGSPAPDRKPDSGPHLPSAPRYQRTARGRRPGAPRRTRRPPAKPRARQRGAPRVRERGRPPLPCQPRHAAAAPSSSAGAHPRQAPSQSKAQRVRPAREHRRPAPARPPTVRPDRPRRPAAPMPLPGTRPAPAAGPAAPVDRPAAPVDQPAAPVDLPAAPVDLPAAPEGRRLGRAAQPAAPEGRASAPQDRRAAPVDLPPLRVQGAAPPVRGAAPVDLPPLRVQGAAPPVRGAAPVDLPPLRVEGAAPPVRGAAPSAQAAASAGQSAEPVGRTAGRWLASMRPWPPLRAPRCWRLRFERLSGRAAGRPIGLARRCATRSVGGRAIAGGRRRPRLVGPGCWPGRRLRCPRLRLDLSSVGGGSDRGVRRRRGRPLGHRGCCARTQAQRGQRARAPTAEAVIGETPEHGTDPRRRLLRRLFRFTPMEGPRLPCVRQRAVPGVARRSIVTEGSSQAGLDLDSRVAPCSTGSAHCRAAAQLSPARWKFVASMKPQGPVALSAIISRSGSPANSRMSQRTSW